ncbi:MAG TPA: FAD-binding oxidoreductase [Solirubrobacteraceae bacterium]|nr:FAD-binding oxidoreductase [Solirubrobacteraceae bacterium]
MRPAPQPPHSQHSAPAPGPSFAPVPGPSPTPGPTPSSAPVPAPSPTPGPTPSSAPVPGPSPTPGPAPSTASPTVVVIGAGAIGLSVAYHLTQLGVRDVTVIERAHPASGSSGRSVGVIETQYLTPLDVELRAWSAHAFHRLEREHELRVTRNGYLRIGHTASDAEAFEHSVALQRAHGVHDSLVLGPREIAERFPDVRSDDISAGLYGPGDGFIDGHRYCTLLAELAQAGGAKLLRDTSLLEHTPPAKHTQLPEHTPPAKHTQLPEHAPPAKHTQLLEHTPPAKRVPQLEHSTTGGGAHVLHTARGALRCDVVVNAAGAWAQAVGELLGVNTPITPQRHEVRAIHLPRVLGYMMPEVMDYSPSSGAHGLYFRHDSHDRLLGGLHSEELVTATADPDDYFEGVRPEPLTTLSELLAHRLPTLADARIGAGWAGLYPVSPDGLPQVGPCPEDPTVLAACGAGGYGIQVSPIVGRLVAEWVAFGAPTSAACARDLLPARLSVRAAPAATHQTNSSR